jgi:RNA polymerase sigma factor for flagellar operon FliA
MNKSPQEKELWKNWLEKKDNFAANELVQNYMYLVSFHVERIAINLPNHVSRDDLESFALMGLYDALKKFELDRELKFDTYASFRIRGSIIDGLRKEDWLPRILREKTKQIEQVTQELIQTLQRMPKSNEIAEKMGITSEEVETIVSDSLFSNVLSIDNQVNHDDDGSGEGIGYDVPDEANITPDDHILNLELREELVEGIKVLNDNEKHVISLFYQDELTMTEIGDVLELTTSRISQIHRNAIFKLRKTLEKIQTQS